jgi:hypothetical protein
MARPAQVPPLTESQALYILEKLAKRVLSRGHVAIRLLLLGVRLAQVA